MKDTGKLVSSLIIVACAIGYVAMLARYVAGWVRP
jgi:TRAP-type mannitol/chloroaromatic compound transport system permease small subunit